MRRVQPRQRSNMNRQFKRQFISNSWQFVRFWAIQALHRRPSPNRNISSSIWSAQHPRQFMLELIGNSLHFEMASAIQSCSAGAKLEKSWQFFWPVVPPLKFYEWYERAPRATGSPLLEF